MAAATGTTGTAGTANAPGAVPANPATSWAARPLLSPPDGGTIQVRPLSGGGWRNAQPPAGWQWRYPPEIGDECLGGAQMSYVAAIVVADIISRTGRLPHGWSAPAPPPNGPCGAGGAVPDGIPPPPDGAVAVPERPAGPPPE